MRISRKIGLSFFITFLLVSILGGLSIYSLRHVYKGLEEVFSNDLPASRLSYQVSISMEGALYNLNNFLITLNENFKSDYELSYRKLQDNIASLKNFMTSDEEKAVFQSAVAAVRDIDVIAGDIFKNSMEMKRLFKETRKLEAEYYKKLNILSDFQEQKMLNEKDLLLMQAQYMPASELVMQARAGFLKFLDGLSEYAMKGQDGEKTFSADEIDSIDKGIKDYKNYYSYSLSDEERKTASDLLEISGKIKPTVALIVELKNNTRGKVSSLFARESDAMNALRSIIDFKKSGISSKLGVGAALTEDIPAIHNISEVEKDIMESWRLGTKYLLTNNVIYRDSYYKLRQNVDKELKDYERHARLRGSGRFFEDIIQSDKNVLESIGSGMGAFTKKESDYAEMAAVKAELEKKIDELLNRNNESIKAARDSQYVAGKLLPERWGLVRLRSGLYDAERAVMNYLNEQEPSYKDIYSNLYFNMKKYINEYRNLSGADKDAALISDLESGLDRLNTSMLAVMTGHDVIIKEVGWTLVKLEEKFKEDMARAMENEITQIENNKKDLTQRIRTINILVIFIIGVVAVIMIFVILYTTKSITNPIQELYKGAEIIGSGNLDHRLTIKTGDEIQDLADGFNRMAGELKELYTNLENKVKERTIQLAEANEALGRTNKELDDFTYIVSHDLKEPLRGIKAFTKLLVEDYSSKFNEEGREYLKTISDSSARMTRLIEDLLNLSRIGRIKNMEPDIDFNDVLSDVSKNLTYALSERNVELIIKPAFPKVTCDRIRISEVFSNLISNAVKYTKKDTRPVVEVGWSLKGAFYEFYVKDNGIGIEKQYYDRVFQIFQRLHAKGEYEGTGAGLTIVKKIVENHGGRIWVDSTVDKGSTFYFTLPKDQNG